MKDTNLVTLVGNLTRDPYMGESKFGKYAFFTVATTDKVDDKEYTQFIECTATKFMADKVASLTKGARVMLIGKIKVRKNKDDVVETKIDVKEIANIERTTTTSRTSEELAMEDYMA